MPQQGEKTGTQYIFKQPSIWYEPYKNYEKNHSETQQMISS